MLIEKNGITRDIAKARLSQYTCKGYKPVDNVPGNEIPTSDEKPLNKMKTEELTAKAAELGADISDAKTNLERVAIIEAFLNQKDGG